MLIPPAQFPLPFTPPPSSSTAWSPQPPAFSAPSASSSSAASGGGGHHNRSRAGSSHRCEYSLPTAICSSPLTVPLVYVLHFPLPPFQPTIYHPVPHLLVPHFPQARYLEEAVARCIRMGDAPHLLAPHLCLPSSGPLPGGSCRALHPHGQCSTPHLLVPHFCLPSSGLLPGGSSRALHPHGQYSTPPGSTLPPSLLRPATWRKPSRAPPAWATLPNTTSASSQCGTGQWWRRRGCSTALKRVRSRG